MELFTTEGIIHIASGMGVPLFMDKTTEWISRLSFARVCVEIDQHAQLPSIIPVMIEDFGNLEVKVEYAWRPRVCSLCNQSVDKNYKTFRKVWSPVANQINQAHL